MEAKERKRGGGGGGERRKEWKGMNKNGGGICAKYGSSFHVKRREPVCERIAWAAGARIAKRQLSCRLSREGEDVCCVTPCSRAPTRITYRRRVSAQWPG